jgi:hypothetical protein
MYEMQKFTFVFEKKGTKPAKYKRQQINEQFLPADVPPTTRPPTACGLSEATCASGECIDRSQVEASFLNVLSS